MLLRPQALLLYARQVRMPHNGQPTQVRVGIHTGDVTTGLIGTKLPKFSVFGDTMNTVRAVLCLANPFRVAAVGVCCWVCGAKPLLP